VANVMIVGSNDSQVNGTFGASGTLSEQFDLTNYTLAGLEIDGAANGTLNFLVSQNPFIPGTLANNYRPVYNSDGTAYALTIPSGNVAYSAAVIVSAIAPYRYVRLLSTPAQSSVAARFIVKA
jgi:hypothetical protein